jgi:hypothetical protein
MRLRADTVLRQIPDAEFHQGLRQLEQAAAAEDPERPPAPLFGAACPWSCSLANTDRKGDP